MASHVVRRSAVSKSVKRNATPSHLLTLSVIGIWSMLLFEATGGSVVSAGEGGYRVDSNTERHVADWKGAPSEEKRTYHAAVSDQELEETVARCAHAYQLSPALLMAVIKAESGFNPMVISKAGAVGLMQLVPETAMLHGVYNLYDTRDNITGGAKHLRYLLNRYHGNVRLALAAYNAGARKVDRYHQVPPFRETKAYVKKVMGFYRDYRRAPLPILHWHERSRIAVR